MKSTNSCKRRKLPSKALNQQKISDAMALLFRSIRSTRPAEQQMSPGDWDVNPDHFSCPESFAFAYLDSQILAKMDDGKPSAQKSEKTWSRFREAEEMCLATNRRLSQPSFGPNPYDGRSPYAILNRARQKMELILGVMDLNEIAEGFGWGPGATTRLGRRRAHAAYKFSGPPECTIGNAILAHAAIRSVPAWYSSLNMSDTSLDGLRIVEANRVITVPKSYKTDRCIAIEPDMNIYVQKGIGAVIRRRLKRAGVDLNDQSRNQRLARVGSVSGSLATIDLSMASDTVSLGIVRFLLPPDWLWLLEQSRTPKGRLPSGELVTYQKFSSMGNGYTFELESAIFYAICLAVSELYGNEDRRISVYGDDIVVPTSIAEPLMETLSVAGFVPNADKTFIQGPFRESCGKHFFRGCDVTPFYVRREPRSLHDAFLLHNNVWRWLTRVREFSSVPSSLRPLLEVLREAPTNPKWHRPRIPDGLGDGAFIGTFDEVRPSSRNTRLTGWIEGFQVSHLVEQTTEIEQPLDVGRLLSSLYSLERNNSSERKWLEGDVPGIPRARVVKTLVPQFADLCPCREA